MDAASISKLSRVLAQNRRLKKLDLSGAKVGSFHHYASSAIPILAAGIETSGLLQVDLRYGAISAGEAQVLDAAVQRNGGVKISY